MLSGIAGRSLFTTVYCVVLDLGKFHNTEGLSLTSALLSNHKQYYYRIELELQVNIFISAVWQVLQRERERERERLRGLPQEQEMLQEHLAYCRRQPELGSQKLLVVIS